MKNKILITVAITLSIILGYASGTAVVFDPSGRFFERRQEVKLLGSKTKLYFVLPSDAYLLRIKHALYDGEKKEVLFNAEPLDQNSYLGIRKKRRLQTDYIYLRKDIIVSGENTLDIYLPENKIENMDVIVTNYRRNIHNDIYVLFGDSSFAQKPKVIVLFIVFYALFLPGFLFLMVFLFREITNATFGRSIRYQVYSLIPLILLLGAISLMHFFSKTYQVVISFRYLLIIGILPMFLIEFCLMLITLLRTKAKAEIPLTSFVRFVRKCLLFIKAWIARKEYGNIFVLGCLFLLFLCPVFLILGSEPLTAQVAEIAYLLLLIAVALKLYYFITAGKNKKQ